MTEDNETKRNRSELNLAEVPREGEERDPRREKTRSMQGWGNGDMKGRETNYWMANRDSNKWDTGN